jgi:hypothetical protein
MSRVPAKQGWWCGYNTTKARAWVINVGAAAWLARCGDQVTNPVSFSEAKTAAIGMDLRPGWARINPPSH